jgi:hypothetical protein
MPTHLDASQVPRFSLTLAGADRPSVRLGGTEPQGQFLQKNSLHKSNAKE